MDWLPKAETLPGILRLIATTTSVANALKVATHHGGLDCYIPLPGRLTADHWLARTIGHDDALAVARQLAARPVADRAVRVPLLIRERRMIAARALRRSGLSARAIAARMGISQSQAANLVAGLPAGAEPLPDLSDILPRAADCCALCGRPAPA